MILIGLPKLASITDVWLLLVSLEAWQGARCLTANHLVPVDERGHLQAIHIIVAVQHRVPMARLGHSRGELSAPISIITRLVNLWKTNHNATLVYFNWLTGAGCVVTMSFRPAGPTSILHKAAFLIPLNVLWAVFLQCILLESGDRVAICVPPWHNIRCVKSARIPTVFTDHVTARSADLVVLWIVGLAVHSVDHETVFRRLQLKLAVGLRWMWYVVASILVPVASYSSGAKAKLV